MMSTQQARHDHGFEGGAPWDEGRLDGRFRHLTARGNDAFEAGEDAEALAFYERAFAEAEGLFDRAGRAGEAGAILLGPMVLNIACHNLAEAKCRSGDRGEGHAFAMLSVRRLIATADSATMPIALRINCVRHLRHALHLAADMESGPDEAMVELVQQAAAVAAVVQRIAILCIAADTQSADRNRSVLS